MLGSHGGKGLAQRFNHAAIHVVIDKFLQPRTFHPPRTKRCEIKNIVVFELQCHRLQRACAHAPRVKRRHQRARTGADHHIGLNTRRFQRLDYAHVRKTARAARTQHQAQQRLLRLQRHNRSAARRISPCVIRR